MPVIPVIGAVVAIGIAAEVGTTLAIVAAVGATVGAVGAITGVKELQIAGAAIGAIGAVGAIASSTGLLGEVGSFLGMGGSEGANVAATAAGAEVAKDSGVWATEVANATTAAPVDGITVGTSLQELQHSGIDGIDGIGDAIGGAGADPIAHFSGEAPAMSDWQAEKLGIPSGIGDSPGAIDPSTSTTPGVQTAEAPQAVNGSVGGGAGDGILNTPPGSPALPAAVHPSAPSGVSSTTPGQVTGSAQGASAITGKPQPVDAGIGATVTKADAGGTVANVTGKLSAGSNGGSSSGVSGILDFLGKPNTLAGSLLQAGSAFVSGATNALTPAQVNAYNAQADANLAQANLARQQQQLLQTQMANASAVPTATRRPGGLINSTAPDGTPQAPAAPQVAGQPQQPNTAYGLINSAYTRPQQITGAPA